MSEDSFSEEVDAFCSQTRRLVSVLLRTSQVHAPRGDLIAGAPVSCSCEVGCSRGVGCLLNAIKICTVRSKRR